MKPPGKAFKLRPESPLSDTLSAQKEKTPSKGVWNRYRPPLESSGFNSGGLMQVDGAHKRDADSYGAGSGVSATTCESC